jgi:hypothetical protein
VTIILRYCIILVILQKDIKRANQEGAKIEREAKKAVQTENKEVNKPKKRKEVEKEEAEEEEVEFVLATQSGEPTKKSRKRRAIPRKKRESNCKKGGNRLELGELEEARELGNTRPAFAYRDPLSLHPFDLVDIPPIDPFLLQDEFFHL